MIPLLALAYFLQGIITSELERKNTTTQVYLGIQEVEKISDLIHELQKERGVTISFLQSNRDEDRKTMIAQRESTNKGVTALINIYRDHGKKVSVPLLDSLPDLRDNIRMFPDNANALKSSLLQEIGNTSQLSIIPEIKNQIDAHLFLMYAKDYLARIRSALSGSILAGGFQQNEYGDFCSLKGQYELSLLRYKQNTLPEILNFFDRKITSTSVHDTELVIGSAFKNPLFLENVSFEDWWIHSSVMVNLFKETEDFSLGWIKTRQETELARINRTVNTNIVIAVVVILIIVTLVIFTIREIVTSISKIKMAAERITQGEINLTIDIPSRDEIGNLASSFNRMIAVSKDYALVADAIGSGDYNIPVNVRGESDVLGRALNSMKDNLQRLSDENKLRTWFLTGNSELNEKIRGEKELVDLATDAIGHLTPYLNAQIGAIYLTENGTLNLAGTYAFHHRKNNASTFVIGEGLIGQAAKEKKPIVFNNIPSDYIKINSGLGNAAPKNILVFPFLYEGEVKGVIELGAAREFTDHDLQFFQMAGDAIGIAFNSAHSRNQLKQLLEETQRQAEELEVQQEELKQSNEELEEKTELLEKSETELKAQQEELQQTNEELEEKANMLEEQKETLESAKMQIENKARELETTSKYKSEFLANMSHELRTPLNSVLILSQILMENKGKVLKEKEIQHATNIYNSGTDLLNLINEILDLAKVESGRMQLMLDDFTVGDVVPGLKRLFTEMAENNAIRFETVVDDQLYDFKLLSDKLRMEQILRNLLSNAFKFTPRGGSVTLSINYGADQQIFASKELNESKDIISFAVKDTGIGIPQDKLSIIFEAFQQVDGSTKRKYGGTGLGLSISRELATTLGGEIQVESEEGKGSTFTLFLPVIFNSTIVVSEKQPMIKTNPVPKTEVTKIRISPEDLLAEESNDDRHNITENDRVILIMEDDQAFADVLLGFIRERNYKGIVTYQGSVGLSFARHYKPDAIILDMKLPVMDGTEVLKHLKSDPDLRHIPVQIISGFDYKRQGMELGAFDFIRKPVKQEELWHAFDKIEDFVSRRIKRLLVVEDDKLHNKAVKELIGNGDVKCFSAYSGEEAIKMLRKDRYDCMILDLGLPDMSGLELLEQIKTDKELTRVPVIIYTGKDLTKEENNRLEKLANTVVVKTAHSHERLLDETMLFLHRVEAKLPKAKQNIIRKLHKTDEVLKYKKVLVVDDDIRNVYSLVNALEEEGLVCVTAENGKEALRALNEDKSVDIVLMDVMMPEMDGYEATREIRKINRLEKLPIIALTAKAMKGDREKCLSVGMSDYISKPLNVEQLLSLMRVWLYK